MQPLISVIVPVYKVEDYLTRCLDSLCRQCLSNIEIILVDDASPDRCGEICNKYAIMDSRFKVFHNLENRGLAAARNLGIRMATSDYIMFVDSDDWVDSEFCLVAYQCAVDYHADIVIFGYYQGFVTLGSSEIKYEKSKQMERGYVTREEVIDHMILKSGGVTVAWNKLYRKCLFDNINFPEGYFFEDIGTGYKLIWQASCIYCADKLLYYYTRFRSGSITLLKSAKARNDWLDLSMKRYYDLLSWGYSQKNLDYLLKNLALSYFIRSNNLFLSPYHDYLKQVLHQDVNMKKYFSWKRGTLFLLYIYFPFLFEAICILMGKKTVVD